MTDAVHLKVSRDALSVAHTGTIGQVRPRPQFLVVVADVVA